MDFEQVCKRVLQYQQTHNPYDFDEQLCQMERRLQRAQETLSTNSYYSKQSSSDFVLFWKQKSEEERLEMIQKTCKWIGIMRGSEWCGIGADEWCNSQELFLGLCKELCTDTGMITHLEDYCYRNHDEQFVINELKRFNIIADNELTVVTNNSINSKHNSSSKNKSKKHHTRNEYQFSKDQNELIKMLATFKRFITYFVINGLVIMYKALFKAKIVKQAQERQSLESKSVELSDVSNSHMNNHYSQLQSSYMYNISNNSSTYQSNISFGNEEIYSNEMEYNEEEGEAINYEEELEEGYEEDDDESSEDEQYFEHDEIPDELTIRRINILKSEGKHFENASRYEDALRSYSLALALLPPAIDSTKRLDKITERSPVDIKMEQERLFLNAKRILMLFSINAYDTVLSETDTYLRDNPDDIDILLLRIKVLKQARQYQEASRLCEYVLSIARHDSRLVNQVSELQKGLKSGL
jgi:tetratricopeptide (TPR) repeat protein